MSRFEGKVGSVTTTIRAGVLIGLLLLVAPGIAVAQRAAAPFVDVGTVTLVTDGSAADIDPANDSVASSDMIVRNLYDTLVSLAGSAIDRYQPALAVSWNSNADKSVWTFHLRHGVTFHTGRCCMSADDVKYSLQRLVTANLNEAYVLARFITNPAKQIKALNQDTVQFDLGRPQPVFLAALASAAGAARPTRHHAQAAAHGRGGVQRHFLW